MRYKHLFLSCAFVENYLIHAPLISDIEGPDPKTSLGQLSGILLGFEGF